MNPTTIHYLNMFLGTGAIALQVISVITLFILFFIFYGNRTKNNIFLDFVKKHFLIIGFLISFFAAVFSLVYSEIINFPPCELCWYQRVFLFPQVFIFGIALWNKSNKNLIDNNINTNREVVKYSTFLLFIGFIVSIYQNFVYYFSNSSNLPCDSSGVSCYQHLISEFGGYISIPMLSLTAFIALLTIILVMHFYKKND